MKDAYIVKADEYCFAITCYEVLIWNVPFDGLQWDCDGRSATKIV
jgi:hypothetical protein